MISTTKMNLDHLHWTKCPDLKKNSIRLDGKTIRFTIEHKLGYDPDLIIKIEHQNLRREKRKVMVLLPRNKI